MIRNHLRQATHGQHERLEALMDLAGPALTRARYGRSLQVLHAVRAGWEPGLAVFLPCETGEHLTWLGIDLGQLGLGPLPPVAPLPIQSQAQAWGARYVLEGSALGGLVLVRAAAALGIGEDSGARYFAGTGRETGRRWAAFLARLEAAVADDADAAAAGAVLAFERLIEAATPPAPL